MPKFCGHCGYKFDANYKFCPECGTKVSKADVDKSTGKKTSGSVKTQNINNSKTAEDKQLDPKVIFGIFGGGAVIILIIILSTGIFDSDPVNMTQMPTETNQGVNLSNLELINELETKIKENPEDHESVLELAHLKNDSGLFEQAIIEYRKYLEHHPDNADARIDMGVCYFQLKDFENAKKEMLKALEYEPRHQIGHLNLGVVNLSAGNMQESKEWFQKAIEIDPSSEVARRAEELLKSH